MARRFLILAMLVALAVPATAQAQAPTRIPPEQETIPICTVYSLTRGCVEQDVGARSYVRDATGPDDCTEGGGRSLNLCRFNGLGWVDEADAGGGGVVDPCGGDPNCILVEDDGDGDLAPELRAAWHGAFTTPGLSADYWRFEVAEKGLLRIDSPVTWCYDSSLPANATDELDCTGVAPASFPETVRGTSFEAITFDCDGVADDYALENINGKNIWADNGHCFQVGDPNEDPYGSNGNSVATHRVRDLGRVWLRFGISVFDLIGIAGGVPNGSDFALHLAANVQGQLRLGVAHTDVLLAGNSVVVANFSGTLSVKEPGENIPQNGWADYVLLAGSQQTVIRDTYIGEGLGVGIGTLTAFGSRWANEVNGGSPLLCRWGSSLLRGPVHVTIADDVVLAGGSYGFEPFCFDTVVHNGTAAFHTNGNAVDYLVKNDTGNRPTMTIRGPQLSRVVTPAVQARTRLRNRLVLDAPVRMEGAAGAGLCVDGGDSANYPPGVDTTSPAFGLFQLHLGPNFRCETSAGGSGVKDFITWDQRHNYQGRITSWNMETLRWTGDLADVSTGLCLDLRAGTGSYACGGPEALARDSERVMIASLRVESHEAPPQAGCFIAPRIDGADACNTTSDGSSRPCFVPLKLADGTYVWSRQSGDLTASQAEHPIFDELTLGLDWNTLCTAADVPFGFCTGSGAGTGPTTLNAAGDAVEMLVNKVAPRGDPIELLASGCTDLSSVTVEVDLIGLSALQGYRGGAACEDGVDNDGDGLFDWPADPECASGADADEAS